MTHAQKMYNSGLIPTRRQQILSMLIEARVKNDLFCIYENPITRNRYYISGGFRPTWSFRGQFIGGDCGARRCRELRRDHKSSDMPKNDWIEKKDHFFEDWDTLKGKTIRRKRVIFRLTMNADEALTYDWTEAFTLPFNWIYSEIAETRIWRAKQLMKQNELFAPS